MARVHPYKNCQQCSKSRDEEPGGLLSARGLCLTCGLKNMEDNNNQLAEKQGPYFEHHTRRTFMAAYARVLQLEKAG